jgi:hypothetical protein
MNFLPLISDLQVLELAYALHPNLSKQFSSFSECKDMSLGLIETNGLKAVLSAQSGLARLEYTTITLRKIVLEHLENDKSLVRLEPLQQLNLRFESGKAMIDDLPLMLPENMPYYALVQHLVIGRLEYVLTTMDVFYLEINPASVTKKFSELLKPRAYQYSQGMYSKFLLMTSTVNVLP